MSITNRKFQLVQKFIILHDIQRIEHIIARITRHHKQILNPLLQTISRRHIIVAISNS